VSFTGYAGKLSNTKREGNKEYCDLSAVTEMSIAPNPVTLFIAAQSHFECLCIFSLFQIEQIHA
jgi:hypothetical protein